MKKIKVGAGAAIIKDKKLLLTKRLDTDDKFPSCWTFPGGGYDSQDGSLLVTTKREMKEELGIDFFPHEKLNFYESVYDDTLIISHVFLGKWSGEMNFDTSEICEIGWFTYDETKTLDIAFAYAETIEDLKKKSLID